MGDVNKSKIRLKKRKRTFVLLRMCMQSHLLIYKVVARFILSLLSSFIKSQRQFIGCKSATLTLEEYVRDGDY